tara:strand:+ start:373 stop:1350 length:978 start_codon:yes stop_codon:yes gene_type:complete
MKPSISKKKLKKSIKIQNVKVADKGGIKRGIEAIRNLEKGDFITFYGTREPNEKTIQSNKMNIFTEKKLLEGDPNDKNKLALGQFSNDNAYEYKIFELIQSGDVKEAHDLYKQNCRDRNNAMIVTIKKPCLIATKDIKMGEIIYVSGGLSYWIYLFLDKYQNNPYLFSRLNTYSLKLVQQKNDFIIFYDRNNTYEYPYEVKEVDGIPMLIHNNEKMSEGIALIILCRLHNLHIIYYSINNLPSWIYSSPYDALLYLNIIIGVIPKDKDKFIFECMINKEYEKAYNLYVQLEDAKYCKKYVDQSSFVYYYKHWTDQLFILHKNRLN